MCARARVCVSRLTEGECVFWLVLAGQAFPHMPPSAWRLLPWPYAAAVDDMRVAVQMGRHAAQIAKMRLADVDGAFQARYLLVNLGPPHSWKKANLS